MAPPVKRDDYPYSNFNFAVDFGTGDSTAGFQEVSGMNIEVTSAEYRAGNSVTNHVIKVNGVYKVGDVTFKRGLIGTTDLYDWLDKIRLGDHKVLQRVQVTMQDEAHKPVMTWILTNARPIKYMMPALNGKTGTEVAIEELVLSVEDLTIDMGGG
jgi:phage tail-like protein